MLPPDFTGELDTYQGRERAFPAFFAKPLNITTALSGYYKDLQKNKIKNFRNNYYAFWYYPSNGMKFTGDLL